ncbi:MAG: helix-hairpin-helix domain-containing protein [candidate division WOR-3 bacterium]
MIVINVFGYTQSRTNTKSYAIIIEEGTRQISINEATVEELEMLPGIGPSLAQRIVEYRCQNGGFESTEDIKKVKGIGDKLFERIKPFLKK